MIRVDSDDVVPILLDVARNDVHVQVRTEAVSTLSRLGTPAAQAALIELLGGD
jgi:HEAT repeat protein